MHNAAPVSRLAKDRGSPYHRAGAMGGRQRRQPNCLTLRLPYNTTVQLPCLALPTGLANSTVQSVKRGLATICNRTFPLWNGQTGELCTPAHNCTPDVLSCSLPSMQRRDGQHCRGDSVYQIANCTNPKTGRPDLALGQTKTSTRHT